MSVAERTSGVPARPGALPRINWRGLGAIAILAGICALPVLLYAPFYNEPFHRDEGFYAIVARMMAHGGVPYRDAFDNKPPMIFVWYYISFGIFGEHIWAPRLLVSLLISMATLLVYFQARFMYSHRASVVAALAFALTIGFAMFETNANVEYWMLLPIVAALLCYTIGERGDSLPWYFAAGALAGLCIMTKETIVFAMALFGIFLIYRAHREQGRAFLRDTRLWAKLAALVGGCFLTFFVVFLPFLIAGAEGPFFDAIIVYTWLYVGAGQGPLIKLGEMIVSPFMMLYATGPWFIFAMFGAWAFWKRRSTDPGKLFWVAWFAASMVGIYAAGRFFAHYYVILFPIMALLIPAGIVYVRDRWQGRRARLVVWSLLVISLLIPVGLNAYIYFQPTEAARHEQKFFNIDRAKWETQSQDLAAWFDARTTPDDYLYDLGFQVDVLFYADRQSPTRFVFDYPFWLDHGFEQEAIADLQAHSPKFVFNSPLDEPNNPGDGYYPRDLYNWIQQNYDYLGKVYYANVWQLKGTSQAPGS